MLIALEASPLPRLKDPPKRLRLAKWGRNESTKGPVVVNESTARVLPRMQKAAGFDRVALDFQHNTVEGMPAYIESKEPRDIAAMGVPLVIPGEGLFIDELEWTPPGVKSYSEGHYVDLSPAVKMGEDGTVVFMHSAGLVRQGSIEGIHAFAAHSNADPFTMNENLLKLLGLKADASEKDIETAIAATQKHLAAFATLQQQVTAFEATIKTLTDKIGDLEKGIQAAGKDNGAAAQITAFSAELKSLTTKLTSFEARADKSEREILVRDAIAAGKVIPFASIEKMSAADAKALLDELPADQVPLSRRTPDQVKVFSSGVSSGEDAAASEVCRQLGISEADYKKAKSA